MLETKAGNLPGYTGYIPKKLIVEPEPARPEARAHIPNYCGFIPGVKSENLYGRTYGNITEQSATNTYNKGIDVPKSDKFRTTTKETFTEQMGKPVYHLHPKQVQQPPPPLGSEIPDDVQNQFWGVKDPSNLTEFEKASLSFYAGPPKAEMPDRSAEMKAQAYSSFWGQEGAPQYDEGATYSYEEARRIADGMK